MEHLKACDVCGEGLVRFDPQTGDARCGNCFANGDPPPVVGGQGREPATLKADASGCAWIVGLVLAGVAVGYCVLALAAWVRS